MLDGFDPAASPPDDPAPRSRGPGWPEEGKDGMRWVAEPRKSAPGLDSLLVWAFRLGASRVSFSTGKRVRVRVHGRNRLATREVLDDAEVAAIANHLYSADGVARLQGGKDFDVAYEVAVSRTERLRFRLNATATRTGRKFGANVVLRPIADMPMSLDEQRVEPAIREAARFKDGIALVGGATGSGKSMLIGALTVDKLLDPEGDYDIVEAAAPVEFLLSRIQSPCSGIDQSEIPRDHASFADFIRGCWRREPTDIIVGECRDSETMAAAIHATIAGAALTTTLHVKNAPLTVRRALTLLPPGERDSLVDGLCQSLRLVVNQRLVPSTDGKRTALREFVVFDEALRRKMRRADPGDWEDLVRGALDAQGQSYATAIRRALDAGLITEQTARDELRREEQ